MIKLSRVGDDYILIAKKKEATFELIRRPKSEQKVDLDKTEMSSLLENS